MLREVQMLMNWMLSSMLPVTAVLSAPASAGEWAKQEVDPYYETDFTAYTIEQGRVRLGLVNLDVGVLDYLSLGTTPTLFLVSAPNIHSKVTLLHEGPVDVSLNAGVIYFATKSLPVKAVSYPLAVQASWVIFPKWSVHTGIRVENLEATGSFGLDALGESLAGALGTDISDDLEAGLKDSGSLYGGAHLTLGQSRFATDYRFNHRDSLIYQYQGWFHLSARVDAGYSGEDENVQVGLSGKVRMPLDAIGTHTLSWQFSWLHWHLRMGFGWSDAGLKNPLQALTQSWELYYLFGKPSNLRAPAPPPGNPPGNPPSGTAPPG